MSATVALPPVVEMTLPTRPSAVTTGWSASMPSLLPRSIWIVEYQTVGDWLITRAVTGSVPSG